MKAMWLSAALLGSLNASASGASASMIRDNPSVEWQCPKQWNNCQLVRLDANGKVTAQANPEEVGKLSGPLTFSPDGKTVYSLGMVLSALDAQTLKTKWVNKTVKGGERPMCIMGVSPDGNLLALAPFGYDEAARKEWGNANLLNAENGQVIRKLERQGPPPKDNWSIYYNSVTFLAFSPDHSTLAIGSQGGGIRLRDLQTNQERTLPGNCGKPRPTAHAGGITGLVWTAPTTLVSSANDGTVRQWNTLEAQETSCMLIPQGAKALLPVPTGQLVTRNASNATLIDAAQFRKVALLGETLGPPDIRVSGASVILKDSRSEQVWSLPDGKLLEVRGADLATFKKGNLSIKVRANMQVQVQNRAEVTTLPLLALPPQHAIGYRQRWEVRVDGSKLHVNATSYRRVMTVEGDDFQNRYVWSLNTGRLESCETWQMGLMYGGAPQKTETDAACKTALQHREGRQHVKALWHE